MELRIAQAWPPNVDALDAAFGVRARPNTIFTYGTTIFNPGGGPLSQELLSHELVHCQRQGATEPMIEKWWESYIADPEFRLAEELPAHVAEYRRFCERHGDPNKRVRFLMETVAKRLASPLYGNLVTHAQAMKMVREAR